MKAFAIMIALAGCNAFELPETDNGGVSPIAHAGTGSTYQLGEPITLDGSASYDPDGSITKYRWHAVTYPIGTMAIPADVNAAVTTYVPDKFGAYHLSLTVEDDTGRVDVSDLRFQVGQVTGVDAGPDTSIPWLGTAHLTGSIDGGAGVATWTLDAKPNGSLTSLQDASSLTPSFLADVAGNYTVTLNVQAGQRVFSDSVTITATATGLSLGSGSYGYLYAAAHDRILALRRVPGAELELIDPSTGVRTTVNAGIASVSAMAMDPAGGRVAIAGTQKVSIVGLSPPQLIDVYDVPFSPSKIVFGPDNRVHLFQIAPFNASQPLPMASLHLVTRGVVVAPGPVKHPYVAATKDANRMYLVGDGGPDFFVYDLTATPIAATTHTTSLGGIAPPVFADELGRWAVVNRGTVYDTTTATPTLKSSLQVATATIRGIAQSAVRNEIAVAAQDVPRSHVLLADGTTFATKVRAPVPEINSMVTSAVFVAYNATSTRLYVIASVSAGDVLHVVPL
jgi:hypothetical protein